MYKSLPKWAPAHPTRKPDNIPSSSLKPVFKPLYLHEPTENINFLLTNEYMRMWFKEKAVYDKNTYIREQIIRDECKIKRRTIQRMATYRKPSKNQFIDEYVERKLGYDKIKNRNEQELRQEKMKFKPVCRKTVQDKKESTIKKEESEAKPQDPEISKVNDEDNEESVESVNGCEIVVSPKL